MLSALIYLTSSPITNISEKSHSSISILTEGSTEQTTWLSNPIKNFPFPTWQGAPKIVRLLRNWLSLGCVVCLTASGLKQCFHFRLLWSWDHQECNLMFTSYVLKMNKQINCVCQHLGFLRVNAHLKLLSPLCVLSERMRRSEDNSADLILSFHLYVGSGDPALVSGWHYWVPSALIPGALSLVHIHVLFKKSAKSVFPTLILQNKTSWLNSR